MSEGQKDRLDVEEKAPLDEAAHQETTGDSERTWQHGAGSSIIVDGGYRSADVPEGSAHRLER